MEMRQIKKIIRNLKPIRVSNEIEVLCKCGTSYLTNIMLNRMNKNNPVQWMVKDDESLPLQGKEFMPQNDSRMTLTNQDESLVPVCETLKLYQAEIDWQCGLHTHVDLSTLTEEPGYFVKNVSANYFKCRTVINNFLLRGRHDNRYCQNVGTFTKEKNSAVRWDKNKNTIEFRQHHATLEYMDIICWNIFVTRFCEVSKDNVLEFEIEDSDFLLENFLNLEPPVKDHFKERLSISLGVNRKIILKKVYRYPWM
jgi:hypothetical protein